MNTHTSTRIPSTRVSIPTRFPSRTFTPHAGERRFFRAKGGWHVRVQMRDQYGRHLSRRGVPVLMWVKEG